MTEKSISSCLIKMVWGLAQWYSRLIFLLQCWYPIEALIFILLLHFQFSSCVPHWSAWLRTLLCSDSSFSLAKTCGGDSSGSAHWKTRIVFFATGSYSCCCRQLGSDWRKRFLSACLFALKDVGI